MIQLTYETIDPQRVLDSVHSGQAGATVLFLGTTRELTQGRRTLSLEYECYAAMAERKLGELEAQVRQRWDLIGVSILHRLGQVDVGNVSIAIAVSSAHRKAAFEAGQWLIDRIKQGVPIWKREFWADGTCQWIHPAMPQRELSRMDEVQPLVAAGVDRQVNPIPAPLIDNLRRVHTNLRISVTDRCNVRCVYCMPNEVTRFVPRQSILTFEEIERFVRVVARLGVKRLRLTGGEPLVREDLPVLIGKLREIPGIADLALTTNGMLLAEQAAELKRAGLQRLNISLDCLSDDTFRQLTRRSGVDRVLAGISVAQKLNFDVIRLNAVAIRGITEHEIIPLVKFAREHHYPLRFIEFMPLNGEQREQAEEQADGLISGAEIQRLLEDHFGPLVPRPRPDPHQPAVHFCFADGVGEIGFINSVTQPFCSTCNRLRITAEGQVRNCLFSDDEWDVRSLLRSGASDEQVADLVRQCVAGKQVAHGTDRDGFNRPQRHMNELGG